MTSGIVVGGWPARIGASSWACSLAVDSGQRLSRRPASSWRSPASASLTDDLAGFIDPAMPRTSDELMRTAGGIAEGAEARARTEGSDARMELNTAAML